MIQTTYSELRRRLARFLDEVVNDCEEVLVKRKDGRDVVLVDAAEYASMKATLRILTPDEDARRLAAAFAQSDRGEGVTVEIGELREWIESQQPSARIAAALDAYDRRRAG